MYPLHPVVKTRFKLGGINVSQHSSKGVMRGDPVGQLKQLAQPGLLRFPKFFDVYPSVRSTDHSANHDGAVTLLRPLQPALQQPEEQVKPL